MRTETIERVTGFTLLGFPVLDSAVFALDNYARFELLVRLHDALPAFLLNPVFIFICLLLGIVLLDTSYKRQLTRMSRNSSPLVGVAEYRKERPRELLWPFLGICLGVLVITPLFALAYSLAYKGTPPEVVKLPSPPICKTVDCFPHAEQTKRGQQAPPTVINAPGGIGISGGHVDHPVVNNFGPSPVQVSLGAVTDVVPPIMDEREEGGGIIPSPFKFEKEITVNVDADYTPVSLAVICSSPLKKAQVFLKTGMVFIHQNIGISAGDSKVAVVYFEGSKITPKSPLWIRIWADQPFTVLQVVKANIN